MAESYESEKPNGVYVDVAGEEEAAAAANDSNKKKSHVGGNHRKQRETLYDVLHRLISVILFPEPGNSGPLLQRIKISLSENVPHIPEACRNTGRDVLLWTRRGSPLRVLLVISVSIFVCMYCLGFFFFFFFPV